MILSASPAFGRFPALCSSAPPTGTPNKKDTCRAQEDAEAEKQLLVENAVATLSMRENEIQLTHYDLVVQVRPLRPVPIGGFTSRAGTQFSTRWVHARKGRGGR